MKALRCVMAVARHPLRRLVLPLLAAQPVAIGAIVGAALGALFWSATHPFPAPSGRATEAAALARQECRTLFERYARETMAWEAREALRAQVKDACVRKPREDGVVQRVVRRG